MPIDLISSLTTRSWARNSPMQTSAAGEAAPPSRVVKLFEGRRHLQSAQADRKACDRRDQQRTAQHRDDHLAAGRPETVALLQIDLDDNDRKEKQHAGGEKRRDDRCRSAFRAEHQQAHRYAHEADIAVAGVQPLDAGIGDAASAERLKAKATAKRDGEAAAKAPTKPN